MWEKTYPKSIATCSIILMVTFSFNTALSGGTIDFNDGLIHDINYTTADSVRVDYLTPNMQTKLNILSGASLFYVEAYGNGIVSVSGGNINNCYQGYDNSRLYLSGGIGAGAGFYYGVHNNSRADMTGGTVNGDLQGWNNGRFHLSGGAISGIFAFRNYCILKICGSNFQINGTPAGYGQYNGSGHITGDLSDGGVLDNDFSLFTDARLILTPILLHNGDERLCVLQPYTIRWSTIESISEVRIEYSTNNGLDWAIVNPPNIGNTGFYDWSVPATASQKCLIRISDAADSNVKDTSDDVFEIFQPTLTILQPNGRERILKGSDYDIKWSSDMYERSVLIEYSTDGGTNWSTITTTQDTGSYMWHVDSQESAECLVRISNPDGWPVSDTSNNYFTVYSCQEQMSADLNKDCVVDMLDFALMAESWLEKGYVRIYNYTLDTQPSNWETQGQWEFGQPTGNGGSEHGNPDPNSGKTGVNVYGVNLNGDYTVAVGTPYSLIAGPFNCSQFSYTKLRFARWLNTDKPDCVISRIQVSKDRSIWNTVWENTAAVTDSNWQAVEYDISETADNQETVYVLWSYQILNAEANPYSGWNVDDIAILGN